jgi:probable phosphoglycerate mutase
MILLARHGRTADNAEGRILGRRDPPLDPAGRAAAEALAASVAGEGLAALWTSPLRRAQQTAAVVGVAAGLEPVVLEDLVESRRGAWEGRPFTELDAEQPEAFAAFERGDADFAFPGGESLRAQSERTRRALDRIARGPQPALAVAHAGTIRAALALAGRPVPPERALPHGEVVTIAW